MQQQFKPGWQVNIELNPRLEAPLDPPQSIEEVIEPPSETMRANFPIGLPERAMAVEQALKMLDFAHGHNNFIREAYERAEKMDAELKNYFDRYSKYLRAVERLLSDI